jgi:hypothetical protein
MRGMLCVVFLLGLLGWAACGVSASPSFKGYTGLVKIPTADTLNKGEFSFGAMTEDTSKFEANDLFANYGPADNMEIGFNSFQKVDSDTRETLLNAKYCFVPESEDKAGVACGLIDFTNEVHATAYTVASKSLARRASLFDSDVTSVRGHIGFGGGDINGLFMGVSAFAGNRVMFSAEWDSKDVNIGLRLTPMKGLRLHAALFDAGNADKFGVGASFTKTY